jgi:hypothetical protein
MGFGRRRATHPVAAAATAAAAATSARLSAPIAAVLSATERGAVLAEGGHVLLSLALTIESRRLGRPALGVRAVAASASRLDPHERITYEMLSKKEEPIS